MPECTVTPHRPAVLDEVFDGEAVLVNLETGLYYALDARASAWWSALGTGTPYAALLEALPDAPASAVLAFVERLVAERLVRVDGELPVAGASPDEADVPVLQVFRDMEDLLLLDPIHDIDLDGSGWPKAPQPHA